ncbi:hypothetical protein SZN_02927 [Streptomyces zinciresistens K42]|uniref:Uncharacterized protein n=1 Tax=Streptomyces zinciresistens K42 TaxID=700597 RepID=G2G532_9ACTN|nr:hypothetical protein SZN_02927 [Streptomyces zinciresistens K42]
MANRAATGGSRPAAAIRFRMRSGGGAGMALVHSVTCRAVSR